jgi:hypothetical protein
MGVVVNDGPKAMSKPPPPLGDINVSSGGTLLLLAAAVGVFFYAKKKVKHYHGVYKSKRRAYHARKASEQ